MRQATEVAHRSLMNIRRGRKNEFGKDFPRLNVWINKGLPFWKSLDSVP